MAPGLLRGMKWRSEMRKLFFLFILLFVAGCTQPASVVVDGETIKLADVEISEYQGEKLDQD